MTVKGCDKKDCATAKGIESCGMCAEYPCEKLQKMFENNKKEAVICRDKLLKTDCILFQEAFFNKKERVDKINRDYFQKNINIIIEHAAVEDAVEILALQKLAFSSVGAMYNDYTIAPLTQTLEEIRADFKRQLFLKVSIDGAIIGSVRGYLEKDTCYAGRLVVNPDFENRGIGSRLMRALEAEFKQAKRYELFTGHRNERNLYLYHKLGYKAFKSEPANEKLTIVYLEKLNKE